MGRLKGSVIVMIDSVVTHNFISNTTVSELNLHKELTGHYGVTLRTGQGKCEKVVLMLGEGFEICEDFFHWT